MRGIYSRNAGGTEPEFTEYDRYLFREGTDDAAYLKMGAHLGVSDGRQGVFFSVWAPNAQYAGVITSRFGWSQFTFTMDKKEGGIWQTFVPDLAEGDEYRYVIVGADGVTRYKSDPYAFRAERRPGTASVVSDLTRYEWNDQAWMDGQAKKDPYREPMSVYEVHPGSWQRDYSADGEGFLNYHVLADKLAEYIGYMGYTHVELIGICEHPLDASWGYQVTGYFAPTSRHGAPDDFRYFVDKMHQCGIGVILDWVPAHFPKDSFALERFDGTPLYEHADPLRAEYPEWGTLAFDYSKSEVRSFLLSNAFYWVREFHIDALRVDAVAAILYNSFGRRDWRPNYFGGTENLEGIAFLKLVNEALTARTHSYLIAEDSSILPGITKPVSEGGLGFRFKWNMGWMNDTLKYVKRDPIFRQYHHDQLTHSLDYAFLEHYMLVLSHDEVVHLKRSMLSKFPGAIQDQLGGLKTLYTYQMTHPGKKLLFMGQEWGEIEEWDEKRELHWDESHDPGHRDVQLCYRDLLHLYRKYPVLYSDTGDRTTFEWINRNDSSRNILSYLRRNPWNYEGALLVICNFAPAYTDYVCGVPVPGSYTRLFSTYDHLEGGGSREETGKDPVIFSTNEEADGYPCRIRYTLRPYESLILALPSGKPEGKA